MEQKEESSQSGIGIFKPNKENIEWSDLVNDSNTYVRLTKQGQWCLTQYSNSSDIQMKIKLGDDVYPDENDTSMPEEERRAFCEDGSEKYITLKINPIKDTESQLKIILERLKRKYPFLDSMPIKLQNEANKGANPHF